MKRVCKISTLFFSLLVTNISYSAHEGAYVGVGGGISGYQNFSNTSLDKSGGAAGKLFAGYNFTKLVN